MKLGDLSASPSAPSIFFSTPLRKFQMRKVYISEMGTQEGEWKCEWREITLWTTSKGKIVNLMEELQVLGKRGVKDKRSTNSFSYWWKWNTNKFPEKKLASKESRDVEKEKKTWKIFCQRIDIFRALKLSNHQLINIISGLQLTFCYSRKMPSLDHIFQ